MLETARSAMKIETFSKVVAYQLRLPLSQRAQWEPGNKPDEHYILKYTSILCSAEIRP